MAKSAINNGNHHNNTNSNNNNSSSSGSSSSSSSNSSCGQYDDHEASMNTETSVRRKYPDYCRTMTIKDANGVIRELVFPKALDLDRPKRSRTTFSKEQLYFLEEEFQRKQYMVGKERSQLAKRLCLTETQVKVWFQNRRTKSKRDKCRETMDMAKDLFPADNLLKYLQPSSQPPCNCYGLLSYQQYTPFYSISSMTQL